VARLQVQERLVDPRHPPAPFGSRHEFYRTALPCAPRAPAGARAGRRRMATHIDPAPGRIRAMTTADASRNMRLLAHHDLRGHGNVGEGMVVQLARDGRRVLWLAHESAPKEITAVDVTDPRRPAVILQTDLPHAQMRSNSLDLAGDLLVVAYQ